MYNHQTMLGLTMLLTVLLGGISHGAEPPTVLFVGDSLTAGYGLTAAEAYPTIVAEIFKQEGRAIRAVNAGVSGDTSAGGRRRIAWAMRAKPDVLVLALGANDGLRGIALTATRDNLQAIIDAAKKENPQLRIVIAGMRVPPNLGDAYADEFAAIFPALAKANDAALIPFLLAGVGGEPELNLRDGIHPNREGQELVAKNVAAVLRPVLWPEASADDAGE